MKETLVKNIGRNLIAENVKWFIYSRFFESKMNAVDFLEKINRTGFVRMLKKEGLYKQTGARHTKKTFINNDIERFIILRSNAKEYAEAILNPTKFDFSIMATSIRHDRNEQVYLSLLKDLLEGVCDVKFQYGALGFNVDMYIPEYQIAIEFDEVAHFASTIKIKEDIARQKAIQIHLGCKFLRIDERANILPQIDYIAKFIIKEITGLEPIISGRFITPRCTSTITNFVTDFDMYFKERNLAAINSCDQPELTLYEKAKISSIEENMAFAIDMGYVTSFEGLLAELRKIWVMANRAQA